MDSKTFMSIVNDRLNACTALLKPKGSEYMRGKDRLHNFKRAGEFQHITAERALVGMWAKHVISILDMVEDLDSGILPDDEVRNEKFSDAINYLLLLEALFIERKLNTEK